MTPRRGALTVEHRGDVAVEAVIEALRAPGETLKMSPKNATKRVGPWVVKRSRLQGGLGPLKHTLRRHRYRAGWRAATVLDRRRVPVPRPVAYVEIGHVGFIAGNALISEHLDGCCNVERHAAELVGRGASEAAIRAFLGGLADVVNELTAAHAYHTDLSGKNIFTRDGAAFYFIDLDGVVLDEPYTKSCRMRNHVQLYDSFCDLFDDGLMGPFLERMLPGGRPLGEWLDDVRAAQLARRARVEARWRREGKLNGG